MATLITPAAAVRISEAHLSLDEIIAVARHGQPVALSADEDFRRRIVSSRETLERKLAAAKWSTESTPVSAEMRVT
jgi:histidine ammonia-lyase